MKELPNSSLLFHALSTNHTCPAKEDTDTDKLKNLFRLMKDKTKEEQAELKATITAQWERTKDKNSTHPATLVYHSGLVSTLTRAFVFDRFENSLLFSVSFFYQNLYSNFCGVSMSEIIILVNMYANVTFLSFFLSFAVFLCYC